MKLGSRLTSEYGRYLKPLRGARGGLIERFPELVTALGLGAVGSLPQEQAVDPEAAARYVAAGTDPYA